MGSFWDTLAGFANPIGSLVGGVVNGVSNLITSHSTNEANKDINESQLAAQKEYWKQQQQNWLQERRWSLDDRAYENAYNSPVALKSRYLAAGINPYLAMQGQSSPASVQAVSPSSPNAPNVPQAHPMIAPDLSGFGLGIQNAINTYLNSKMNETQIASINQHMQNETAKTIAEISRFEFQNKETEAIVRGLMQDWQFNNDSYHDRLEQIKFANEGMFLDNEKKELDNEYQLLINKFTPKEQEKILRNLDGSYSEILSRVRSNDASAARDLASKALMEAQREGVDISNEQAEDLTEFILDKAANEAEKSFWDAQQTAKRYREGTVGNNLPADGIGFTRSNIRGASNEVDIKYRPYRVSFSRRRIERKQRRKAIQKRYGD